MTLPILLGVLVGSAALAVPIVLLFRRQARRNDPPPYSASAYSGGLGRKARYASSIDFPEGQR